MKKLILLIFCGCSLLWAEPKVVAVFGGENCPWSEQLRHDVWDTPAFQALLSTSGIQKDERPATSADQETPVLVLISSKGEEIGRLGFLIIPPEKYADLFKEMLAIHDLSQNLDKLSTSHLLHFYRKCQVLNMKTAEEKILTAGLAKDTGVDFLLEHYAKLRKDHPHKAHKVKEEIRSRSPSSPATEWQLALLSFQARNETLKDPLEVVKPLHKYLKIYGEQDRDTRWRCHLILAEFYKEKGMMDKARLHAEQSALEAPDDLKQMILPLGNL